MQDVRFLRAEEIKELLAWTAQELQTVQDSAGKSRKRRCMVAFPAV